MVPSLAGSAPKSWTETPKAKPMGTSAAMETCEAPDNAARSTARWKRHTADAGTMAAAAAAARAAVRSAAHSTAEPTAPTSAPTRPLIAHRKRPSDNDFSFMAEEEMQMPSQPKRPRPQPIAGPDVRRRRAHSF